MEPLRVVITVVLMGVSVFVYAREGILIALPFIVATVAVFLLSFTKIGALPANRRISKFTFNAIREEGVKRIRAGTFHVDEVKFTESVEKIRDVLSNQQYFPEFGIDGMFLSYPTEDKANVALERIRSQGVKADTLLDRRNWLVKVEFD